MGTTKTYNKIHYTIFNIIWITIPIILVMFWFYIPELNRIFDFYVVLLPLLLLICLFIAIYLMYMMTSLVIGTINRKWIRVICILFGPIIGASFFIALEKSDVDPQWITFQFQRSYYISQAALLPHTDDMPRLKSWNWGETGGAGVGECFYTLVFDENDEIILPINKRSEKWMQLARRLEQQSTNNMFRNIEIGQADATIKGVGNHFLP